MPNPTAILAIAAWLSNVIMLPGLIRRLPLWIFTDTRAALCGKISSWRQIGRFHLAQAHLAGLISPIWLPVR